jgi:hypothetical protein
VDRRRDGHTGQRHDQRHQRHIAPRPGQQEPAEHGDPDQQREQEHDLPAPPDDQQHDAREGQCERHDLEDGAERRAPGGARAVPHVPHLSGDHPREVQRLVREVVDGVLAADPLQRCVAGQVRVLLGDAVEQRRHRDPAELAHTHVLLAHVAGDEHALDVQVQAVPRQVGADEQRLAATCADRHEAALDAGHVDRPREHGERERGRQDHRSDQAAPPQREQREDDDEHEVLGPRERGQPEQHARRRPRPA